MKKNLLTLFFYLISIYIFSQGKNGAIQKGENILSVSPLDGSTFLGQTYDSSACGLNFVQASQLVETRSVAAGFNTNGTGLPTTLNISGLPSCNTILKAYVWYIVSYIGANAQPSSVDITNPALSTSNSTAAIIGTGIPKCWGETGTAVYRADVTSAISGNGIYGININGITGTNVTFPNWYDQIDGVTLFIIYKDYSATYQGSLVIWDGNITSVSGAVAQTMAGINACGNSTSANAFLLVSDMQGSQAPPQHTDILNGSPPTNFSNDFYNFDQINTTVTAAQATANYGTTPSGGDCFTWGMMGLYYQTTTCTTCTPSALSVSITSTPAACGNSNGTATATASGILPYTYSWNPTGQTTQTATGLLAGTYTVTVTDSVGCITVDSITVIPSPPLSLSFPVIVNADCFGNNTGSASVNVSSGTPPYTYSWSSVPAQTTQTATGLAAGNYSVTVIDSFGCSITNTVSISEPLPLSNSFSTVTNVSCFGGSNGSAIANISGGTPQYIYSWSNGQTTSTATNLSAGNYTVTVTDSMGCVLSNTIAISSPPLLTHSFSAVTNVDCFGNCTGAATANGAGGTPSYTYAWNSIPIQSTQTATGLCAGTYSLTVTDANGCSLADTVTIISPTGLGVFSPAITNVDCFGNSTGSATLTPFGGTPGYTYSWNPTAQTNATATGLIVGIYSVTITDNNGCVINTLVQITEPTQLFALASQTNILCFGDSTGTATMNVSGATPGYIYFWSPSSQTTSTATNLSAGNYTATITDASGCTITSTFTITQPAAPLSTVSSVVNVLCNPDSTGSASVSVSGGTAGYTYLWNTNATTSSISNLPAGNYSVMISDANGCLDSSTVTITQPPLLTSTQNQINILCFGDSTGTATVSPAGGNPAYTYLWSNGQTNSVATNLSAGNYFVTVSDANGCTLTVIFLLTQPAAPLSATSSSVNVFCNPDSTGSASVTVSGGTGSYTYLWSNGQTTSGISNIPAGTYTVTFTDANGCSDTSTATVNQPPLLTAIISNDTIVCAGASTTFSVTAAGGNPAYTYLWNPIGQTTSAVTVSASATTIYSVTVTDANGCSSQQMNTTVTVVPLPVATISVSPSYVVFYPASICFTADTGNTLSWIWNFGDSATATGTSSVCHDFEMGTFCVTLSVANYLGCIDTAEVCVSEVSASIPNVFSPNGDGSNDMFFIPMAAEGLTYYSCRIYDRWGIKMAELDLPREGWDGYTTSGVPASEGTYYYVVSIAWGDELKINERGFITLVR